MADSSGERVQFRVGMTITCQTGGYLCASVVNTCTLARPNEYQCAARVRLCAWVGTCMCARACARVYELVCMCLYVNVFARVRRVHCPERSVTRGYLLLLTLIRESRFLGNHRRLRESQYIYVRGRETAYVHACLKG